MAPTKANDANEQFKLEKKKQKLKERRQSEENMLKETKLREMGEKPGQTKLFK